MGPQQQKNPQKCIHIQLQIRVEPNSNIKTRHIQTRHSNLGRQ